MAEKTRVPAIRFNGFTEAWEQRKFADMAIRNSEMAVCSSELPSVEYEDIISGQGILNKDVREKPSIKTGIRFSSNDVLFGKLRPYLKNWFLPDFSGVAVGDFWVLHPFQTDSRYLYYLIQTPAFQTAANQSTGTKMPRSDWNLVSKTEFLLPKDIAEQRKIGATLQTIDNLITLHQRKLSKLQNVKKAMLEKMFPKNGSDVPEIRFSGFTEAWEQRKLEDEAIEIVAGGDIDKNKIVDFGKYPVLANALTNDGMVGYYNDEFRIKAPAVTVTGRGDVGHAKARNIDFTPVVRLLSIRTNHDVDFLEHAINNHSVIVESTGVPQLTVPQLSKYQIYFPKTYTEEKSIGVFFKKLDNLITLHQRKLEKLQNLKKACLEKMFV